MFKQSYIFLKHLFSKRKLAVNFFRKNNIKSILAILKRRYKASGEKIQVERREKAFTQLSQEEKNAVLEFLQLPIKPKENILISLVAPSRVKENPNCRLSSFLNSFLDVTENPNSVEILIRLDDDDDFLYYHAIKEAFKDRIQLRFIIGKRYEGYLALHKLVSELLPYLSPTSEIVFEFTDDCILEKKGWDKAFINSLDRYPDKIFFLNTLGQHSLDDFYNEPHQFFWSLWHLGPPSLFVALNRRVLEITSEVAKAYEGWCAYGNNVLCDSFFETLQMYLWQLSNEKREVIFPKTIYAQPDIAIPAHKQGGLFSASPVAQEAYKGFLTNKTQSVIYEMAQAIYAEMDKAQG